MDFLLLLIFKFSGQSDAMMNRLAMGCPVYPIVANIFMAQLEEKAYHVVEALPLVTFCG